MRAGDDIRHLARYVAEELFRLFEERGVVITTRNLGKEVDRWRDDGRALAPSGLTNTDDNGESLWSMIEAKEIIASMKRKKKRSK